MTAKEKAWELAEKYHQAMYSTRDHDAKTVEYIHRVRPCCLILADEIIKETKLHDLTPFDHSRTGFWIEVKEEITKL